MTPIELQDELVDEMGRILDGHTYKSPDGSRVPVNVFAQNLPISETDDEDDAVPYIIVRLDSGEDSGGRDSFNTVSIIIIIGIWDNALDRQGYRDVVNIIQKIYQRFHKNPDLNRKAAYAGGFEWAIQDEDCHPYNFGACHMEFHIASIRREDCFA